jgi:hypothetical protein
VTHLTRSLVLGCSVLALAACGPDDIVSPGTGGNVIINNPPSPTPSPTPTPTPPATVSPAAGCPTIADPQGLTDAGTISGPTGTWRVCTLPRVIRTSSTLPKVAGLLYQMNGRVDVGCDGGFTAPSAGAPVTTSTVACPVTQPMTADSNVNLTIAAGAILFGGTGQSWLAVNRGNRITAIGSETQPIIFTSRDNVLGLNNDNSQGQWGGVVLMGRGRVTDCTTGSVAGGTCERQTEGAPDPARFGGADDAYNAGRMSYVQVRFSGFILGSNVELQSLTPEAIGSGTVIDHFQSFNSSDDGIEFFGGVPRAKHLVITGADDDSLDVDVGAQADFQHVLLIQRPGQNDALFEIDSNGNEADLPRTRLRVANFVGLQPQASSANEANNQASAMFRGNSDTTLVNGVIVTPNNECIRMNGSGGANSATLTTRSVVMQCNATKYIGTGSYTAATVAAAFGTGTNNNNDAFTSTLTTLFVNGANEDAVPAFDASTLSAFFDVPSPNRIGAAWTGNNAWYNGWTCNSAYANFGTGNSGDCTSLPIT